MLNRSASLAMSTSIFKALPGKLDIKRHSPSFLYMLSPLMKSKIMLLFKHCNVISIALIVIVLTMANLVY